MEDNKEHLQAINDIRTMMERSSRCISLSGLSGVFSGIFALVGAFFAIDKYETATSNYKMLGDQELVNITIYFFEVAGAVLISSLLVGTLLTIRNSKRKGLNIWDGSTKRLIINLAIPLVAGGLFCLVLLYHGIIGLVAPATLIFYGLALLNASKYTFNDIRYLGICEIILGLLASFFVGYGLLFWAVGFGILHIIYGTVMYFKYERNG